MNPLRQFLCVCIAGLPIMAAAIGLTVVLPDGSEWRASKVTYETGSGRVVVTEAAMFAGGFE